MIIIGLVGEMGAGKSTIGEYLVKNYGAARYGFSTILRDLTNRLYLPPSRDNLIQISIVLRQEFGNDLLAKAMIEDIKKSTAQCVVVESIRREDDIAYLRTMPNFHLIGVEADLPERFKRLSGRGDKTDDDKKSYEEFVKDHERETEKTVPLLLKKAEFTIHNNGNIDELYPQVDAIMAGLKNSGN